VVLDDVDAALEVVLDRLGRALLADDVVLDVGRLVLLGDRLFLDVRQVLAFALLGLVEVLVERMTSPMRPGGRGVGRRRRRSASSSRVGRVGGFWIGCSACFSVSIWAFRSSIFVLYSFSLASSSSKTRVRTRFSPAPCSSQRLYFVMPKVSKTLLPILSFRRRVLDQVAQVALEHLGLQGEVAKRSAVPRTRGASRCPSRRSGSCPAGLVASRCSSIAFFSLTMLPGSPGRARCRRPSSCRCRRREGADVDDRADDDDRQPPLVSAFVTNSAMGFS
jgi:hypothetical protein